LDPPSARRQAFIVLKIDDAGSCVQRTRETGGLETVGTHNETLSLRSFWKAGLL